MCIFFGSSNRLHRNLVGVGTAVCLQLVFYCLPSGVANDMNSLKSLNIWTDRQPQNVPEITTRTQALANDLKTLYISKDFSDITFKLKDGVAKGHKNILSVRSSRFKEVN